MVKFQVLRTDGEDPESARAEAGGDAEEVDGVGVGVLPGQHQFLPHRAPCAQADVPVLPAQPEGARLRAAQGMVLLSDLETGGLLGLSK